SVERGEALPLLANGTVDPRETALVEGDVSSIDVQSGNTGSARVTEYEPDALTIETETEGPGFLVVSEIYNDGWRAYVDGEPAEIVPTNHALRGLTFPAGTHEVEMRYEPHSLRIGLWISGLTAVAMVAVFAVAGWTALRRGRGRRREVGA
ncbi:MAG: YfhO family protein, partial [Thermomicrobiales bacterium]